ncbi:MAG: hypothetical protein H0W86_03300 [Armatimonadetes bacterium]|nr:hypothetical protein [Candidatus Dependentiae bacterium]MBA3725484.1 hypothetical protein [Armatimonadota bacterium]
MGELKGQPAETITVLDMEASIEHLTRGTLRNVDVLLVVTEPYYRSLETVGRTVPLAKELGLERVYVVANKVRTPEDTSAIEEYCRRHEYHLVGSVPFDDSITEADRKGKAVIDYDPSARSVQAVGEIAKFLISSPVTAGGG